MALLLGALLAPGAATSGTPVAAQQAAPSVAGDLPAARTSPGPQVVPGSVLITRTPGVAAASLTWTLAARGLRLRSAVDPAGVAVVDTGGQPVEEVVAELEGDPSVTSVSPNYVRSASAAPNDPMYTPYQRDYAGRSGCPRRGTAPPAPAR